MSEDDEKLIVARALMKLDGYVRSEQKPLPAYIAYAETALAAMRQADTRAAAPGSGPGQTMTGGGCLDCGRAYGDEYGFPDLVLPHSEWAKISPTGDDGGLLCPSCICKRAYDAEVRCAAVFRSGPFGVLTDGPLLDISARLTATELAKED